MLGLFKKRESPPPARTFKTRVELFWEWYASVADRFYQTIEESKCSDLADEVQAQVHELLPGFAWVFGPGAEGKGHSFTLTGEGVLDRQLLAGYWLSRARRLAGWTFYASRQPGRINGFCIELAGHRFDPLEFWITPVIDNESEKVDITVWHPLFERVSEHTDRLRPLFLFLDEVLGEFGTGQWIGEIKVNDQRLTDAFPLSELLEFVTTLAAEKGWRKFPPGEEITLYRCEEPHERFLRGDIVVGNSANMELINSYLEAEGQLEDPLDGTGADYAFVSFDVRILPEGEQSAARGILEDALDDALCAAQSGQLLGGAHGVNSAYIDLLLVDGTSSLDIVRQVLIERKLPPGTAINFFAKEKRAHRIVL
jgi:hypothetical protein